MKPIVIIGGTFLIWITLNKRLSAYAALVNKKSATAGSSPTSFNASAAPSSFTLDGAVAAGKALLDGYSVNQGSI